ncbi:VOC family protein [Paenibacillus harenae]|uniref:VOC family protein n=1 Tax=Paenibacillus harenae TaxID=306543 RepID=UPI0003F50072|nr:VOC family protein [Paenibacillus harenae]
MSENIVIAENLLERIDFIQLSVSDLNRSVAWYEKHFGFKQDFMNENLTVLMPPTPIPTGLPTLILNKAGNNPNWFVSADLGRSSTIGFHTKNVQKLYEYFKEQQIEVSEISDGGFAYFMNFYDLDGNMFEVIQLK